MEIQDHNQILDIKQMNNIENSLNKKVDKYLNIL